MIDYVVGFMFSEDKKHVALMKKNRPKWQVGKINALGGKVEDYDNDVHVAISREFEEESGIASSPNDWTEFCVLENPGLCHVHFLFTFNDDVYNAKTMEDEEVSIYEVDNLPDNVIFNLKWLINMCLDDTLIFEKPICLKEQRKVSKDYEDRCNL